MLLDIGVGIILGLLLGGLDGGASLFWYPVIGILFALLPDLDFVATMLRRRSSERHRDGIHYPLILTPLVAALVYLIWPDFTWLAVAALLSHFLHDSVGIGWGVKWLFPFSSNSFSFFYHIEDVTSKKRFPRRMVYVWREAELSQLMRVYGDPNWFRNIYLAWHPYAIFEVTVFLIGVTCWITAVLVA